jgi:hypothetical protein
MLLIPKSNPKLSFKACAVIKITYLTQALKNPLKGDLKRTIVNAKFMST